jgi:phosphoribosylglycinamide formyltransferase-1
MKLGILISGRGSNMLAIAEAVENGTIPNAEIAVVISDKPSAQGLIKAQEKGIETLAISRNGRTREEHDAEIAAELKNRGVELVCLAGYMRLLSRDFIRSFPNQIINIHPSLLPSFRGLAAQEQAFEYGVKFTGCTVHFVDEELDHGAIIAQKIVEVKDDDTSETLSHRILEQEHQLYIEAIAKITGNNYEIIGRKVKFVAED